jgi:hypothetical protein
MTTTAAERFASIGDRCRQRCTALRIAAPIPQILGHGAFDRRVMSRDGALERFLIEGDGDAIWHFNLWLLGGDLRFQATRSAFAPVESPLVF